MVLLAWREAYCSETDTKSYNVYRVGRFIRMFGRVANPSRCWSGNFILHVWIQANRHEPRLDMRQMEVELAWAKTQTKSYCSWKNRRRKVNSSYEANERRRVRQRAPIFNDSLVSFLFAQFLLVNTFFPVLCRFTFIIWFSYNINFRFSIKWYSRAQKVI